MQIHVLRARYESYRRVLRSYSCFASLDNPSQHTKVVAESGPEILAAQALPEPVHVKNPGQILATSLQLEPVSPVVSEVVAAERLHRHRIATHDADCTYSRCSC